MYTGTLLAVLASTAMTVGLYLMKRAVNQLPALDGGVRLHAWGAFIRDPWWLLSVALQTAGYGVYLAALRLAPLSVVHTALNGGIAFFVVLAVFGLGERIRPLEWIGVAAVVVGLIALSSSVSPDSGANAVAQGRGRFAVIALALAGLGLLCDRAPGRAIGLSIASGLLLGLAGVYAKTLANAESVWMALGSSDLLLTILANIVGFVLMQAALQAGRGVIAMPIFSTLSNLVAIIGGLVVFGETLPTHGAAAALRLLAFVCALGGAALLALLGEIDSAIGARPETVAARAGNR